IRWHEKAITAESHVPERALQAAGPGQRPGSPRALRPFPRAPPQPGAAQPPFSPFRFVPPQPKAFPDMAANPSLQPVDRSAVLGQSVVPPPAPYILPPSVPSLVTRQTLATPPLLPYLRFESLQTRRCRFDLHGAVQVGIPETCAPRPSLPRSWWHSPVAAVAFQSIPVSTPSPVPPPPDCLRRYCSHPRTG